MLSKIRRQLNQSVVKNSALRHVMLGSLATAMLSFLTMTASARIYEKIEFGQLTFVLTLVISVGGVIGYGLGSLGMRVAAEATASKSLTGYANSVRTLKVTNRISAASAVILLVLLWMFLDQIAPSPPDPGLYVPLAFSVYFYSMDAFLRLTLLGRGQHGAYSWIPVMGYIPYVILILLDISIKFVAIGWLSMSIFNYLLSMYFYQRSLAMDKSVFKVDGRGANLIVFVKDALPVIVSSALVAPVQWLANLIIVAHSGTYANSAIYVLALQWFALISFAPNAVARAIGPALTREYFKFSRNGIRSQLLTMLWVGLAAVAVPAAFIFVFQSPISHVYGRKFSSEMSIINFAIIASCASVIASPVSYLLLAAKKLWLGALLNAAWAVIFLSGAFLATHHGISWVMIAMAAAYIFQAAISWIFVVPQILKFAETS